MATATVRPNETVNLGGASVTGAADAHTATSDDSDASYISLAGALTQLGFAEPVIPSGAAVRHVRLRTRSSHFDASPQTIIGIPVPGGEGQSQVVGWLSPTTSVLAIFPPDDFDVADAEVQLLRFSDGILQVREVFLDFVYVTQPSVTVFEPVGTITDNNQPTVNWSVIWDSDGGNLTHFEAKIFDAATFGDFSTVDPDISDPFIESGEVASAATSYELEEILPNDTYRVYVRIAQMVNGELHWSEWDFEAFTMDTDAPGDPLLTLTPQPNCGRMQIVLDNTAGAVNTEGYQVQRSDDGGVTWANIRTVDGDGIDDDLDGGGAVVMTDAEAPNGVTVKYRARAVHFFAEGNAYSGWTEDEDDWTSTDAWLKHPHDPTLNMVVTVYSQAQRRRAARRGVHNVLGRSDPIVTSDVRGPADGEITFDVTTEAEQEALDALLDTTTPLLLQMPADHHWPDRWVSFGDHERARIVDKLEAEDTLDSLPWTEVARPSGNLLAWPDPACP